jgi:hypothetical protein
VDQLDKENPDSVSYLNSQRIISRIGDGYKCDPRTDIFNNSRPLKKRVFDRYREKMLAIDLSKPTPEKESDTESSSDDISIEQKPIIKPPPSIVVIDDPSPPPVQITTIAIPPPISKVVEILSTPPQPIESPHPGDHESHISDSPIYDFPVRLPHVLDLNAPVPLESESPRPFTPPEPMICIDLDETSNTPTLTPSSTTITTVQKPEEPPYRNLHLIIDGIDKFSKDIKEYGQNLELSLMKIKQLTDQRQRLVKVDEEQKKKEEQRELVEILRKKEKRKEEILQRLQKQEEHNNNGEELVDMKNMMI